jgi:signal peptidase I
MGVFGIFGRVIVEGTSMQPTYNPLDWLLVHYGFFGKKYLF